MAIYAKTGIFNKFLQLTVSTQDGAYNINNFFRKANIKYKTEPVLIGLLRNLNIKLDNSD